MSGHEHSGARSVLINNTRKILSTILGPSLGDSDANALLAANGDRSNNPALEALLKFPHEKKPTPFAPVLFPSFTKDPAMTNIFLGPPVLKVHRMMYFGISCVEYGSKPASHSNGVKLGLKSVTASSIALSATLLRFVLSPDKEWSSIGAISKITWEADYRTYVRLLTENSNANHVKNIFKVFQEYVFSATKVAETLEDDGTEAKIAEAMQRFALGVSGVDS